MRALLLTIGLLLAATATATEHALVVPAAITPSSERAQRITQATIEKVLRSRGYIVDDIRWHGNPEDASFMVGLLSQRRAALAVSVLIKGRSDDAIGEFKNDWTVTVRALRHDEPEPRVAEEHCEACAIGLEAQQRLATALDRALDVSPTPSPVVGAGEATTHVPTIAPAEIPPPVSPQVRIEPHEAPISSAVAPTHRRRAGREGTFAGLAVATTIVGAGGIVMLALGAKLVAENGHPTCGDGAPSNCPTVYATQSRGEALLIPGAIITAAAAVAVGVELAAITKQRRSRRYALAPMLGNRAAGIVIGGAW
jgi:hypothetical protein